MAWAVTVTLWEIRTTRQRRRRRREDPQGAEPVAGSDLEAELVARDLRASVDEVLGELGVIGFAILWLVPLYAAQNLRELWRYVRDDAEDRGLIATLGGLLLFDIILSFKQGSMLGSASTFALAVILGRVVTVLRKV